MKSNRDWPFITFESDEGMDNGVTIPVKQVAYVKDWSVGGCIVHMLDGYTISLLHTSRAEFTALMAEALS